MDETAKLAKKALGLLLEAKKIKFEKIATANSDKMEQCLEEASRILETTGNRLGADRKKRLSYDEFCVENENIDLQKYLESRLGEINTMSDAKVQKILKDAFLGQVAEEIEKVITLVDSSDEKIEKELGVEKDFMSLFKDYLSEDKTANKLVILSDIAALEAWWAYYDTKLSSFVLLFLTNETGKLSETEKVA